MTLLSAEFATARSNLPFPSKSAIATARGVVPTAKSDLGWKVPSPFPTRTDTVFAPAFAVTRSGLPSLFRSPTATA